jgi:hypothetical protein
MRQIMILGESVRSSASGAWSRTWSAPSIIARVAGVLILLAVFALVLVVIVPLAILLIAFGIVGLIARTLWLGLRNAVRAFRRTDGQGRQNVRVRNAT